jgi:HKD family nuclease
MSTALIQNDSDEHLEKLLALINGAEEISIAGAFIKDSGMNLMGNALKKAIRLGATVKIIAGRNFGLTEPKALWDLFDWCKNSNSALFLSKYESNVVFHPKMYLFSAQGQATLVVGSANMTSGGLANNHEVSMVHHCKTTDKIWKDAIGYFELLLSNHAVPANRLYLMRYEGFYKEARSNSKNTMKEPRRKDDTFPFEYSKIKGYIRDFKKKDLLNEFAFRNENYNLARNLLNDLIETPGMTQKKFTKHFEELVGGSRLHPRYWNSNGLYRGKNGKNDQKGIIHHWRDFIAMVKIVKKNRNKSAEYVFNEALPILGKIPFGGVNLLTEIMMTYNPTGLANLNNSSVKVLRIEAGCDVKKIPNSYSGSDYKEYNSIMKEVCLELGFENMIELDWFLNRIYWDLKKRGLIK